MLKDTLFTIQQKEETGDSCIYHLSLNALHPIYAAHFPGNPVTPGACIVQIIKELTEDIYQKPLSVHTVKNTKFLNVINPLKNREITIHLSYKNSDDKSVSVSGNVIREDTVFAKVSLILF
ncbi:MAG: hypothetical protein LBE91_03320 [Tannerella sp.]|jgi:3-hydroxyacyl-[acyl-carrier-protein] dehydratase|nr:hypothetical protein [Tannerella sp.]